MLRAILLAALSLGAATLTFAMLALGSLLGFAYRSSGRSRATRKAAADRFM